jgi:hypothetical protein
LDKLLAAAKGRTLMVSILPLPFTTTAERWAIRDELVWAYNPVCQMNGIKAPPLELARKLDELDKKHQEQTAQVMLLLANVNRLFEPQTLPGPRRRIGFLPQSEPASPAY